LGDRYLYIHTFGCQMNVHDSEQTAELLKNEGFIRTGDPQKADLVLVNTCSIREKAEQKAHSQIGRFKALKKANPHVIIGVGGCLAQQWKGELLKKAPFVDLVFGTQNIHRLPELLVNFGKSGTPLVDTSLHGKTKSIDILALPDNGAVSAYVTVMQGCNNFCAFCVVPYLRGREESRDEQDILREVTALADCGVKEITLLGQNVNAYGKTLNNGASFAKLLIRVGKIKGIERIRFTTSHPKDLTEDIIRCYKDVPALCEHIHLPVQSGSDRILEKMNRHYSRCDYMEKVDKLRDISPGISITSDIIVGFPGESNEDYENTLDLMERVRFDGLFSFKYSERPGTKAATLSDKVEEEIKSERLVRLQALQKTHTLDKNRATEGLIEDVLVEGRSKNSSNDLMGRTRSNRIINFSGDASLIGKTIPVRIKKAFLHSLRGEMLNKQGGA